MKGSNKRGLSEQRGKNSERVKIAYEKSGLTYDALAKLIGVKRNSLACWITGRRNPSDIITSLIEEKVSVYLNGGGEYINKDECRNSFAEDVCDVLANVPLGEQPKEIMNAFDRLPTVSIKAVKKGSKSVKG